MFYIHRWHVSGSRPKILDALKTLEQELEVKFSLSNGNYSDSEIRYTLTMNVIRENTVITKELKAWHRLCKSFGLKESDLGRSFYDPGLTFPSPGIYVITGINPRAIAYPIQVMKNGRTTYFRASAIRNFLNYPNKKKS